MHILIIIAVLASYYFIPRLLVIAGMKSLFGEFEELYEIELGSQYYGRTVQAKGKGITFELPIYHEEYRELAVDVNDDMFLNFRGLGYGVMITRKKGEPIYENIPIESSDYYNNAETMNEYEIINLDMTLKDITIFQSIKNLRENYLRYSGKNHAVRSHGNNYAVIKDKNYVYLIIINNKDIMGEGYDSLVIKIYV